MKKEDVFYFYVENEDDKCVIEVKNNFQWKISIVKGNELYGMPYEFDNKNDIEDIFDWFSDNYTYVLEITKDDIEDYA